MRRNLILVIVALVAGACASGQEVASRDKAEVLGVSVTPDAAAVSADPGLAGWIDAEVDSGVPPVAPPEPTGIYGYSRYVYAAQPDGVVVPTLVEGPRGEQVRCQDDDLLCSFADLEALQASGDPIPEYLGMDAPTLEQLVEELGALRDHLETFDDMDDVCAAGYVETSTQNPNMGVHMTNMANALGDFDPTKPAIILMAKENGETLDRTEMVGCSDGGWGGDDGYEVVGAAFVTPITDKHPDGFAGPIDNWHVHYNTCNGASDDLTSIANPPACEAKGGSMDAVVPVWMIHAYAAEGFESEQGVFAMFNGSIWPRSGSADLRAAKVEAPSSGVAAPIVDFDYGDIDVAAGESVVFSNSDGVPHTVTSGAGSEPDGAFDSGVIGSGQAWSVAFDDPGEYALFCALHPQMQATITVSGS